MVNGEWRTTNGERQMVNGFGVMNKKRKGRIEEVEISLETWNI